jgi:hypothetical protein
MTATVMATTTVILIAIMRVRLMATVRAIGSACSLNNSNSIVQNMLKVPKPPFASVEEGAPAAKALRTRDSPCHHHQLDTIVISCLSLISGSKVAGRYST